MELDSSNTVSESKLPSMISANIRGLNPGMKYSKIEYLNDLANDKNAIIMAITESHLSEGILDSEISIKGWAHVRADRDNWIGGGVIVYVKDDYTISSEISFSNSVCETVCIYINKLNIGLVTIYQLPNSDNDEFIEWIDKIEEWMADRKKRKKTPNL